MKLGRGPGGAGGGGGTDGTPGVPVERLTRGQKKLVATAASREAATRVGDKFRLNVLIGWFISGMVLKMTLTLAYLGGSNLKAGAIQQVSRAVPHRCPPSTRVHTTHTPSSS